MNISTIQQRYGKNEWVSMPAADIVSGLIENIKIQPLDLTTAFQLAIGKNPMANEVFGLYISAPRLLDAIEAALATCNLASLQILVGGAASALGWQQETIDAISEVIAENSIRFIDDVMDDPPQTVDEDLVNTAMSTAGYSWGGSAWVKS